VSALIFWLSPLFVYISRTGYEVNITLLWQLLFLSSAIYIFFPPKWRLSKSKARWFQVLALIGLNGSFFLAFFSYHAAKFSLPVMAVVVLGFSYLFSPCRRRLGGRLALISGTLILVFCLCWSFFNEPALRNRQSELVFNADKVETIFQEASRERLSFWGDNLFLNRYSSLLMYLLNQYLYAFDIPRLMTGYESGYQFSLAVHGFFFWSSLIAGLVGAGVIIVTARGRLTDKPTLWLWLLLVVVAPVATTIGLSEQSIFRSCLLYVLLIYPMARGWLFLWQVIRRKKVLTLLVAGAIVMEVIYFGYTYFAFFPVKTADNFSFAYRLLAGYLTQVKTQQPQREVVLVLGQDPSAVARGVIFYNQLLPQLTLEERRQVADINNTELTLGTLLTITSKCPVILGRAKEEAPVIIYDQFKTEECNLKSMIASDEAAVGRNEVEDQEEENGHLSVISSPRDSGGYYYIVDDTICTNFSLPDFIHQIKIENYQAEKLDPQTYCGAWVRRE
jgi:hypothetical protein